MTTHCGFPHFTIMLRSRGAQVVFTSKGTRTLQTTVLVYLLQGKFS